LPLPPGKRVAIVACMDARLNPYGLLGLNEETRTSSETPAAL
jgi:carbonic anhydrase